MDGRAKGRDAATLDGVGEGGMPFAMKAAEEVNLGGATHVAEGWARFAARRTGLGKVIGWDNCPATAGTAGTNFSWRARWPVRRLGDATTVAT